MGTGTGSGLVALFALLRQGFFIFSLFCYMYESKISIKGGTKWQK
jgi:hypothetical protein